jgi:hypothetical protein
MRDGVKSASSVIIGNSYLIGPKTRGGSGSGRGWGGCVLVLVYGMFSG